VWEVHEKCNSHTGDGEGRIDLGLVVVEMSSNIVYANHTLGRLKPDARII